MTQYPPPPMFEPLEARLFLNSTPVLGAIGPATPLSLLQPSVTASSGRAFFASPTGGGDGTSLASPFRVWDFWSVARPGDTLMLLDGRYTGYTSMILPTSGLSGTAASPITIRALNEGHVEIDGQGLYEPVALTENDYFTIEGLNVHDSRRNVVVLRYSNHCTVRRVCAWNAADTNAGIFGAHEGVYNLFEDCAGWGTARKVFSASQGGDHTTFRRCWGRWEGSHVVGPKTVFATSYNSYDNLFENCIGTWDARRMRETYTLLDYEGNPWTGAGAGTYTDYQVQHPVGIFKTGRLDGSSYANTRMVGCVAYTLADQRVDWSDCPTAAGFFSSKIDGIAVQDCLSYSEHAYRPFGLYCDVNGDTILGGQDVLAHGITSIGPGAASVFDPYTGADFWDLEALYSAASADAMIEARGTLLQGVGGLGANLKYRSVNGELTEELLWSWPMDDRIADAMVLAGYDDAVHVTETLLGLGRNAFAEGDGIVERTFGGQKESWFTDAAGNLVRATLDGPGTGRLVVPTSGRAEGVRILLDGTTAASNLRLSGIGWSGQSIQDLLVRGSLKSVSGQTAGLGFEVTVNGYLGHIVLSDPTDGWSLDVIGPGELSPPPGESFVDAALPSPRPAGGTKAVPSPRFLDGRGALRAALDALQEFPSLGNAQASHARSLPGSDGAAPDGRTGREGAPVEAETNGTTGETGAERSRQAEQAGPAASGTLDPASAARQDAAGTRAGMTDPALDPLQCVPGLDPLRTLSP